MILTNARLILADGVADGLAVVCHDGKITAVQPTEVSAGGEKIDLRGNFLAPGFIDLHLHGALGRDTMEGTPEAFRAICDYHASGGTTSLLLTTATAPMAEIVH
ncbi:MAG: N-acetylglucosamine-6-phosphate deacetylase, partial [Verrucomicrobiota bacterium]|nr:N-acetylglucosamine-6-phosphate deacetylase [Verrucomicrobiota bacterium]